MVYLSNTHHCAKIFELELYYIHLNVRLKFKTNIDRFIPSKSSVTRAHIHASRGIRKPRIAIGGIPTLG
jgi:hypothetical protein